MSYGQIIFGFIMTYIITYFIMKPLFKRFLNFKLTLKRNFFFVSILVIVDATIKYVLQL